MFSLRRFKYEIELLKKNYGKKILNPTIFTDIFFELFENRKLIKWKSINNDIINKNDLLERYNNSILNLKVFVKYTIKEKIMSNWIEIDNNNFNSNIFNQINLS